MRRHLVAVADGSLLKVGAPEPALQLGAVRKVLPQVLLVTSLRM